MSSHMSPCVMTHPEQFHVKICTCGVVHLSFGFAMMNMAPEAAIAVSETLNEVAVELKKKIQTRITEQFEPKALNNIVQGAFSQKNS